MAKGRGIIRMVEELLDQINSDITEDQKKEYQFSRRGDKIRQAWLSGRVSALLKIEGSLEMIRKALSE